MKTLYAILDPEIYHGDLLELALKLERGGVSLMQLRAKNLSTREMISLGKRLKEHLKTPLLINDRVDIALACQADGVHLGQSDMPPAIARKLLGVDKIIGITLKTKANVEEFSINNDISYGCLGGIFATTSKINPEPPHGLENLKSLCTLWKAQTNKPFYAIAGISLENAVSVMKQGVDGFAVISALSGSKDPELTARQFVTLMENTK